MASLQQIQLTNLASLGPRWNQPPDGPSSQQSINTNTVVAYHRRQCTLLISVEPPPGSDANAAALSTVRRDDRGVWLTAGPTIPWVLPSALLPLISALPLESMDAFLLVAWNPSMGRAVLNFLGVGGICVCPQTHLSEANYGKAVICGDFDQNRKDLLVALDGGRVQSYAIRRVSEGRGKDRRFLIQAIFRRQTQLSKEAGKIPVQVATGDISGAALILSRGGITCLDTGNLDRLWFVSSLAFVWEPTRIWQDKFGSDFIVKCCDPRKGGKQVVEYWNAPTTFAQAEAGSFNRVVIPLHPGEECIDLAFENVGKKHGTMLCLLLSTAQVQLWRPVPAAGEIFLDSAMQLIGNVDIACYKQPPPALLHGNKTLPIMPANTFMSFAASVGTPDCPLCVVVGCGSSVCTLAVHTPASIDSSYTRTLLDLSLMQMQDEYDHAYPDEPRSDYIQRFTLDRHHERDIDFPEEDDMDDLISRNTETPLMRPRPYYTGQNDMAGYSPEYVMDDQWGQQGGDNLRGDEFLVTNAWGPAKQELHNRTGTPGTGHLAGMQNSVELHIPSIELLPDGRSASPFAVSPSSSRPSTHYQNEQLVAQAYEEYSGILTNLPSRENNLELPHSADLDAVGENLRLGPLGTSAGPSESSVTRTTNMIKVENSIVIRPDEVDNDAVSLGSGDRLGRPGRRVIGTNGNRMPGVDFHSELSSSLSMQDGGQSLLQSMAQISINLPTTSVTTASHILQGMGRGSAPIPAPRPAPKLTKPKIKYFAPARLFPCLLAGTHDDPARSEGTSFLRIVTPSLAVLNSTCTIKDTKNNVDKFVSQTSMAFLSRHGFDRASASIALARTLECHLQATACRSGLLTISTPLKETFMFDLKGLLSSTKRQHTPLKVEYDIRQSATATFMVMADVCFAFDRKEEGPRNPVVSKKGAPRAKTLGLRVEEENNVCAICLTGDSDGKLHYAIGTPLRGALDRCAALSAHNCPIKCILATGDASRPLWRIGVDVSVRGELTPRPAPGSAVITMGADGEIKVWQPVFMTEGFALPSRTEQLLACIKMEWRLSGLFSGRARIPSSVGTVGGFSTPLSATLDPGCVFILLGHNDGSLEQWPVPGLVDTGTGGLMAVQSRLWGVTGHSGPVQDMAVFVHSDSEAKVILVPDISAADSLEPKSRIVCSVKAPSGSKTIGYNFDQLKRLAENSSMCTCSGDMSIILWRFIVSKDSEDWSNRSKSSSNSRYLYPLPCRRFGFSSQPSRGLCFTPLNTHPDGSGSLWRLSAIVGGIIVTAMQASWANMFAQDESMLNSQESDTGETSSKPAADAEMHDDVSINSGATVGVSDSLQLMPVFCQVLKPSRTAELLSNRVKQQGEYSWLALQYWMEKDGEPLPPAPRLDANFDQNQGTTVTAKPIKDAQAVQCSVKESNIIVPFGDDVGEDAVGAFMWTSEGLHRHQVDGVRIAVREDLLQETEAQLTIRKGQPKHKFLASEVPAPPDIYASTDGSLQPTESLAAAIHKMIAIDAPASPIPSSRNAGAGVDIGLYVGFTDDDNEPGDSPSSAGPGSPVSRSPGLVSRRKDIQDGIHTRSIDINVDDDWKLRLRRGGGEGAMTSELVLESPKAQTGLILTSEMESPDELQNRDRPASQGKEKKKWDKKKDGEFEIKQTNAMKLKQDAAKKNLERAALMEKKKPKTLYVSKSQKELSKDKPPVARQVMGSSFNLAVPLNFAEEALKTRAAKTVVDKGLSKARKPREMDADRNKKSDGNKSQEKGHGDGEKLVAEVGDDWHKDDHVQPPVSPIAAISAPTASNVRMSRIGIVLNEYAQSGDNLQVVIQETDAFSAVPTYFDRTTRQSFVYERKDNARKPRIRKSTLSSRPRSSSVEEQGSNEDEPEEDEEAAAIMGDAIKNLSVEEKQSLGIIMNEFTNADLDMFEGLDEATKLQVLQEIQQGNDDGTDPEELGRRASAVMKRAVMKLKVLKKVMGVASLLGKAAKGGIAGMFGGKGALPAAEVILEVQSYSQKQCKLSYMTTNTCVRMVVFAMKADHETGSDANKMPPPLRLETITMDELKSTPGVVSCAIFPVKDGSDAPAAPDIVVPTVAKDAPTPAPIAPTLVPATESDTSNEIVLGGLEPENNYRIYCFLACSSTGKRTFRQMNQGDITDNAVVVNTLPEVLDIEWQLLSDEQKCAEIRAANRSFDVLKRAALEKAPVSVPSDNDLILRMDPDSKGRTAMKEYNKFFSWWAPPDKEFISPARSAFLLSECLFYCKSHAETDPESSVMATCKTQGIFSENEISLLASWVSTVSPDWAGLPVRLPGSDAIIPLSQPERLFKKFRSWYKGGEVLQMYEKDAWEKQQSTIGMNIGEMQDSAMRGSFARPEGPGRGENMADSALNNNSDSQPSVEDFAFAPMTDELQTHEIGPFGFPADQPPVFEPVLSARRMEDRTTCLENRKAAVELASTLTAQLIDRYKAAEKKGIGEKDLTLRRAKLMQDDLELIMASIKLLQLCLAQKLIKPGSKPDASKLGFKELRPTAVCGADIFAVVGVEMLTPDNPPALVLATLPGTNRRPIRAWQLCSEEEKTNELMLAVMLDNIMEIAIEEGVSVPDPEDFDIDKLVPLRADRLLKFTAWYAGDEYTNKVPGMGIPTLARVLFAEQLESKAVTDDPFVTEVMIKEKLPLPETVLNRHAAREEIFKSIKTSTSSDGNKPVGDVAAAFSKEGSDDLKVLYENSLQTAIGLSIRLTIIRRYIDAVITSRRQHALRIFWPPGPARLGNVMIHPPAGLLLPKFELPAMRFRALFASTNKESAYTHKEMEQWYTPAELDADDKLMWEAELDGRRRAAYLEWLALETVRQKQTRLDMLQEDRHGQSRRAYYSLMDDRLRAIERLAGVASKTDFALEPALPGEYGFIKEDTIKYEHGSGVENEDELEDLKIEQQRRAEEDRRKEIERKRLLEVEKKRKMEEEAAIEARKEQDRRLAEGIERRRHVRQHLEQVKNKRAMDVKDAERAVIEAEHRALVLKMAEKDAEKAQNVILTQQRNLLREQKEIEFEDFIMHEFYVRSSETGAMEHEDLLAAMVKVSEERVQLGKKEKLAFYKELYTEFVPFEFKKDKVRVPTLHSFLSSYPSDYADYSMLGKSQVLAQYRGIGGSSQELSSGILNNSLSLINDMGTSSMDGLLHLPSDEHKATSSFQLEANGDAYTAGQDDAQAKPFDFRVTFGITPHHHQTSASLDREIQHLEQELEQATGRLPFQSTLPKSALSPLILQPLIWNENQAHDRRRSIPSNTNTLHTSHSSHPLKPWKHLELDNEPPLTTDGLSNEALLYAFSAQDAKQRRPHTSGSFGLYIDADPVAKLDQAQTAPGLQKYTLPALDRSYARTYTNLEFANLANVAAGDDGAVRAMSADRPSRSRRKKGPLPSNELDRRPSVEILASLLSSSVSTSQMSPPPPIIGATKKNVNSVAAALESYLLGFATKKIDTNMQSGRAGMAAEFGELESGSLDQASHGGSNLDALNVIHAPLPAIESSTSLLHSLQSRHLLSQTSQTASEGATSFDRKEMSAMLSQSADVANAIMQRHRLELLTQHRKQTAASLAVLDRKGNRTLGMKKKPSRGGLYGQGTNGPISQQTIDAANLLTQAYIESKEAIEGYVSSKSVVEDKYFLCASGAGGEIGVGSAENIAKRKELLGLVEEGVQGQADQMSTAVMRNTTMKASSNAKLAALSAGPRIPIVGYASEYPSHLPQHALEKKLGERFSRAERAGLKFTRIPSIPPTPANEAQRPFGVRGGHYAIKEFHPKYGMQPLHELMGLGDEGLSVGEGSMELHSVLSSHNSGSRSGSRSVENHQKAKKSRTRRVDSPPFNDGISGRSIDSTHSFALSTGTAADDEDSKNPKNGSGSPSHEKSPSRAKSATADADEGIALDLGADDGTDLDEEDSTFSPERSAVSKVSISSLTHKG